jgi:hypothetical protein
MLRVHHRIADLTDWDQYDAGGSAAAEPFADDE